MTIVMGVLNVTPDSFSDGGRHDDAETAVAHGRLLASQGAGIVDVGGESTRPGAARVPEAEEMARVIPVIAALAAHGITCSVDTMRASVARAAVAAGARIVNDVSGGLADPGMLGAVADLGVDYVAMHWRGHSEVMQQHTDYTDVVADVAAELAARRNAARPRASRPNASSSTRGSGSPRPPNRTGGCCAAWRPSRPWDTGCWLVSAANVSWVSCWTAGPPRTATPQPPPSPRGAPCTGSGRCAPTRCPRSATRRGWGGGLAPGRRAERFLPGWCFRDPVFSAQRDP